MSSTYRASYLRALFSGCVILLLATITHAQNLLQVVDVDRLAQREQLQQQLAELESTLGKYDPGLIETLSSLADSSALLNLYSEAGGAPEVVSCALVATSLCNPAPWSCLSFQRHIFSCYRQRSWQLSRGATSSRRSNLGFWP